MPSKDLLSLMKMTGSYLKVVDSNDFDFGAGDFTMEYWYHEGNDARTERSNYILLLIPIKHSYWTY